MLLYYWKVCQAKPNKWPNKQLQSQLEMEPQIKCKQSDMGLVNENSGTA